MSMQPQSLMVSWQTLTWQLEMGAVDIASDVGSQTEATVPPLRGLCCLHLDCMRETSAARWRATRLRNFGALDCTVNSFTFLVETSRGCKAAGYSTRLRCICVSCSEFDGSTCRPLAVMSYLSLVKKSSVGRR